MPNSMLFIRAKARLGYCFRLAKIAKTVSKSELNPVVHHTH